MKTCPKCKTEKDDSEFYRHPVNLRLYPYCRPCAKDYSRERSRATREKKTLNV